MADYNVNMKQWNGTSFDNVLPLAYNALALNGKTALDIQREINAATGLFVGSTDVVLGYTPLAVVVSNLTISSSWSSGSSIAYAVMAPREQPNTSIGGNLRVTPNGFHCDVQSYPQNQQNATFGYVAIGRLLGFTTITESTTFTVKLTGRYNIYLHGGGGGASETPSSTTANWEISGGGGSGEKFENVTLTAGEQYNVVVGKAGTSGASSTNGGATSFGSYSVNGGGRATYRDTPGAGSGSLGKAGTSAYKVSSGRSVVAHGGTGGDDVFNYYGVGASITKSMSSSGKYSYKYTSATDGCVILEYLGA